MPAKLRADVRGDLIDATFPFLARLSGSGHRDLKACRVQTIGARRAVGSLEAVLDQKCLTKKEVAEREGFEPSIRG